MQLLSKYGLCTSEVSISSWNKLPVKDMYRQLIASCPYWAKILSFPGKLDMFEQKYDNK